MRLSGCRLLRLRLRLGERDLAVLGVHQNGIALAEVAPEDVLSQRGDSGSWSRGHNMRANIWRLPPGVRGARHLEHVQEELFVVLEGTATLLLGDPPERVELPCGSVAVVETETALQLRNESDAEATVLIVGALPVQGKADCLPDVD